MAAVADAAREATHADLLFPSKYLRACDLMGRDVTVTIESVILKEEMVRVGGAKETKPALRFVGKEKLLVLGKTNKNILKLLLGPYHADWPGKRITLYPDPTVMLKGERVVGLRVRPNLPRDTEAP